MALCIKNTAHNNTLILSNVVVVLDSNFSSSKLASSIRHLRKIFQIMRVLLERGTRCPKKFLLFGACVFDQLGESNKQGCVYLAAVMGGNHRQQSKICTFLPTRTCLLLLISSCYFRSNKRGGGEKALSDPTRSNIKHTNNYCFWGTHST